VSPPVLSLLRCVFGSAKETEHAGKIKYEANVLVNRFQQEGNGTKPIFTRTARHRMELRRSRSAFASIENNGYSILALTDHDKTNDVTGLSTKDFL
jgi:hypothetical protein